MFTCTPGFRLALVAALPFLASLGCGREEAPTSVVVGSPAFSVERTPQTFTVGPLALGGIEFLVPGGNLHIRDALLSGPVTGEMVGTADITLNADLDGLGNGPAFGKVTITTSGGVWEGSLTGHFQGDLPTGILLTSRVTLHGPGQQLLKAECDEIPPSDSETLACSGVSADPGT
jgi:hypothetical protein